MRLFRLSAGAGRTGAQYNLGFCYDNGTGVGKNMKEAVRWNRVAANAGRTNVQRNLPGAAIGTGLVWTKA